ncbi:MAG: DUF4920 domain-containing protein [Bacteroidota bacterium]
MKKLLFLFAAVSIFWACEQKAGDANADNNSADSTKQAQVDPKSEDDEVDEQVFPEPDAVGNFGAAVSAESAIEASQVSETLGEQDSLRMTIKGEIAACCKKKGCWMTMPLAEEQEMFVKFKDYGFFVPLNSGGKTAVVDGWAYREVVSVDELRHYAEDEGRPKEEIEKITEPEERITFMADGVIIE